MIQNTVYRILASDPTVRQFVEGRIYPGQAAQEAELPYIVYQFLAGDPVTSFDGISELQNYRLQLDCYSEDYDICRLVARASEDALTGSNEISTIVLTNAVDFNETTLQIFQTTQDFSIWFYR